MDQYSLSSALDSGASTINQIMEKKINVASAMIGSGLAATAFGQDAFAACRKQPNKLKLQEVIEEKVYFFIQI